MFSTGEGFSALCGAVEHFLSDPVRLAGMDPFAHLDWALHLPLCTGEFSIPEASRDAINWHSADPSALCEFRWRQLKYWKHRQQVTAPAWRDQYARLPAHVRAILGPEKNLALFAEMLEASGSPDIHLAASLAQGFPLAGYIPPSGTMCLSDAVSHTSPEELLEAAPGANASILQRVRDARPTDGRVAEGLEARTRAEVAAGQAEWRDLPSDLSGVVLSPRFAADEGWRFRDGQWSLKVRAIDDLTASGVNGATTVSERVAHETLDDLVAAAQCLIAGGASAADVRFRKDDVCEAYKTLPLHSEHLPFAAAVTAEAVSQDQFLQLLCCPFGGKASVHAWQRVGAAFQAILLRLFSIVYPRFVDDFFGIDAEQAHEWGDSAVGAASLARFVIQDLLGWRLDPNKAVTAALSFVALGVRVSVDATTKCLNFVVPSDKCAKWLAEIAEVLRAQRLTPAHAQKLAGRLSWGATAVFGKGARVYLAPLFRHSAGRSTRISKRLCCALLWWQRFLNSQPSRAVPLSPSVKPRLVVYTDASGAGVLAWVAVLAGRKFFASVPVPGWLARWACPRQQQIHTWELVAAVCALWHFFSLPEGVAGLDVVIFIDSTVALGTLLRGCSRQRDWNAMVAGMWFAAADRGHFLNAFRVSSHLNLADWPTRPEQKASELAQLVSRGFARLEWAWPAVDFWQQRR